MPRVDFGPWLPDRPAIRAPHVRTAKNVVPAAEGYEPLRALAATTNALDDTCRGAVGARDIDQAGHIYAGDATKLYELEGATWTDRSRVGGYGPATDSTRWRFTTFGDRLIAVNGLDEPQYIDMSTAATSFADLAGSPPTAQFISTYGDFVFLGALSTNAMAIKWSGFSDSEGWTAGVNQSDEQEFTDGGRITGLGTSQAAFYVFQESCIRRVLYTGGATIFQIDKIVDGVGCIEPNSLVQIGQRFFFLGEDGWYMWDGASEPAPIGAESFDEWFLDDSSRAYWHGMSAAIDPRHKLFLAAYASTGSGAGRPDSLLIYNYAVGKASYARVDVEFIFNAISLGISIDDLTSTDIDALTVSLDDPAFLGGTFYLGAFSTTHALAGFTGSNLEATLETGEFPLFDGQRARIEWVRPVVTGDSAGAVTAAAGAAVRSGDAITFASQVAQQASGRCPQRGVNGFYSAARVVAPAAVEWTDAIGLEFSAISAGRR